MPPTMSAKIASHNGVGTSMPSILHRNPESVKPRLSERWEEGE